MAFMDNRLSKAWIETKLSLTERNELFASILEETASPTGEQILEKIKKLFPKKKGLPSIRAINRWKSQRWNFVVMIYQMRKTAEEAREVIAAIPDGEIEEANKRLINEILFRKLDDLKKNPNADEEGVQSWIIAASKLGAQKASNAILKRKAQILDEAVYDSKRNLKAKKEYDTPENKALRRAKVEIARLSRLGNPATSEQMQNIFEDFLEEEYSKNNDKNKL